jgi:hypothetical protein
MLREILAFIVTKGGREVLLTINKKARDKEIQRESERDTRSQQPSRNLVERAREREREKE